jgi:hypothetical protein
MSGHTPHSSICLHGKNRTNWTPKKKSSRTTTIGEDCVYFVLGTAGQRDNTNMTKGYVKEKWKGREMKFIGQ